MAAEEINKALKQLECFENLTDTRKCDGYTKLIELIGSCNSVDELILTRCLKVAAKDLSRNRDLKYAIFSARLTLALLEIIKKDHLTSSSISNRLRVVILNNISVLCSIKKLHVDTDLKYFSIQLLVDCPAHVILDIALYHRTQYFSLLQTFLDSRAHESEDNYIVENVLCMIVIRTINSMPEDKKNSHMERGLVTWFKYILPCTMHEISINAQYDKFLEVLDVLTENLKDINYSEDPSWVKIMENLLLTFRYPRIIENVFVTRKGGEWAKIWCILIKFIRMKGKYGRFKGNFLHNMLAIIMRRLKGRISDQILSFQCWTVLTDSLSEDKYEEIKRLNLLMVPMKDDNAKDMSVAQAKFMSWWHIIRVFHDGIYANDMQKVIIIPFLHYCFTDLNQKCVPNVRTLYVGIQCMGVMAFTSIVGHCDNCLCKQPTIPVVQPPPFLRASFLVDSLPDWKRFLQVITKLLATLDESSSGRRQINCVWKSCFTVVASMSDNRVRADVAEELFNVLAPLVQAKNTRVMMIDVLVTIFYTTDSNIKNLLLSDEDKDFKGGLITKTNEVLLTYYKDNYDRSNKSTCFHHVTSAVKTVLSLTNYKEQYIKWVLLNVSQNTGKYRVAPLVWTALTHAVNETKCSLSANTMFYILMWPLRELNKFSDTSADAAIAWHKIHGDFSPSLKKNLANDDKVLNKLINKNFKPVFIIYVVSTLLKTGHNADKRIADSSFEKLLVLLAKHLSTVSDLQENRDYQNIIPDLTECLIFIMTNKLTATIKDDVADNIAVAVSGTLKLIVNSCQNDDQTYNENNLVHIDMLLSSVITMYISKPCMMTKSVITDAIMKCSNIKVPHIKEIVLLILKNTTENGEEVVLCNNDIPANDQSNSMTNRPLRNKKGPKKYCTGDLDSSFDNQNCTTIQNITDIVECVVAAPKNNEQLMENVASIKNTERDKNHTTDNTETQRIPKELKNLTIDMVEGNPQLHAESSSSIMTRRKSLIAYVKQHKIARLENALSEAKSKLDRDRITKKSDIIKYNLCTRVPSQGDIEFEGTSVSGVLPHDFIKSSQDSMSTSSKINQQNEKESMIEIIETAMDTEPELIEYSPKLISNVGSNNDSMLCEGASDNVDINTNNNELPVNKIINDSHNDVPSPFEGEDISPVRATCSEIENDKTPSPDTSDDNVIKILSSPQTDGEPAENDSSEQSPLKDIVSNLPGLYTPKDNVGKHAPDSSETVQDISNRASVGSTEQSSNSVDDNVLKSTHILPTADSGPSAHIIKRKIDDITSDKHPLSNKKQRVSDDDPPISTTVEAYKDQASSPQNEKLPERKLSVEVVDSLNGDKIEEDPTRNQSKQLDPIFPDLIHCEENINTIISKLSSPSILDISLLSGVFEGRINTIGDLAKLTEPELLEFPIHPPILSTTMTVLANYLAGLNEEGANNQNADDCMQIDEYTSQDVLRSINCTSRVIHSCFVAQQDDQDPMMKIYKQKVQEKILNKIPLEVIVNMVRDNVRSEEDKKLILNQLISDNEGLQLLKRYFYETLNPLEIFGFCIEMLSDIAEMIE